MATAVEDEDRLRLAIGLSESTRGGAGAHHNDDESRLRQAMRHSEQAFLVSVDGVLGALHAVSPILASFIDENCAIFSHSLRSDADTSELHVFSDFRRTVDMLLADLLSEVGMTMADVASALQLARSNSTGAAPVEHLLAVESFETFRRMSACAR